jgi:hypothetical protein
MSKKMMPCECADPGCPIHPGLSHCEKRAEVTLRRADMEDWSGVRFCADCADDAMESGVFTSQGA